MFESTTSHLFAPNPLRRMAAVVAGAALYELLPQAVLIGGGESEVGFFYDFLLDDAPVPELATLIKEKMKGIYSHMPPFRETEMVVGSASALFKKKNHLGALGHLEDFEPKELVSVVHLGEFVDLAEGPFNAKEKAYVDRLELRLIDGEVYRLEGCVECSPDALKAHVKKINRYQKQNYRTEGEALGWWFLGADGIVWLPKGLSEFRKLTTKLKEIFCSDVPEVAASSEEALQEWSKFKKKTSYWRLESGPKTWDSEEGLYSDEAQNYFTYTFPEDELESLLQTIEKFHIIFAFRPIACLNGWKRGDGRLEKLIKNRNWEVQQGQGKGEFALLGYAEDGLGRFQKIWEIRRHKETNSYSLKLGVERILALLVEMNLGK